MLRQVPALLKLRSYRSVYQMVSARLKRRTPTPGFQYSASPCRWKSLHHNLDLFADPLS